MKFIFPLLATCLAASLAAPIPVPQGRQGQGSGTPATTTTTTTNTQGGKPANGPPAAAAASPSAAAGAQGAQASPAAGNTNKQAGKGGQGAQAAQASPTPAAAIPSTAAAAPNGGGRGGANPNPAQGGGNTATTPGGATGKGAQGSGAPTSTTPTGSGGTGNKGGESNAQAAQAWMADTGTVSDFLNRAASLTGSAFTAAAQKALAAEKDELTHKAVIDADASLKSQVSQANNVLATQGNFQQVVDLLQDMVTKGESSAAKDVAAINKVRCVNVLPDIDIYLAAAGTNLKAVRPAAC